MNAVDRIFGTIWNARRSLPVVLLVAFGAACSDDTPRQDSDAAANVPASPAGQLAATTSSQPAAGRDAPASAGAANDAAQTPVEPVPEAPAAVTSAAQTPAPVEPAPQTPVVAGIAPREATQHIVQGVVTQWRPMILFVEPGDQIVFRGMTGHDTESMEGLTPEGSAPWKSKLGEEGFSITLDTPGAYIYKCNPHVSTGMVGAIVVGPAPPDNLTALAESPQNKGMIGRAIRKLNQALEAR